MNADENEKAVLSCLLTYPDQTAPFVCAELRPEHFVGTNATIYREILGLFAEGQPFDIAAIAGRLRDKDQLEAVGGFGGLSALAFTSAVPSVIGEHVRAVKDKAAHRKVNALLRAKLSESEGSTCDVSKLLGETMAGLEEIGHDRAKKKAPSMKQLVTEALGRIQGRYENKEDEAGVSTGVPTLDKETGGLRPGSQWVLAGPAKGGKSSLAVSFLRSLSVDHKKRTAFFGLEMPSVENVERLICNVGKVSASNMRDGVMAEADFPKLTAAASKLSTAPILFRDDIFDLAELVGTARQMKAAYPDLFAIFVDYAQLLGAGLDGTNREREVAVISRTLRKLSMQAGLCVILLSQVNDDGRLRESRALGMDATTVVFIEFTDDPGARNLKLVQRNGRSGIDLKVAYIGDHFQFADLAPDYQAPEPEQKPTNKKRDWRNRHQ